METISPMEFIPSQVFFADIADFASITDALVPEDLVELLR